VTATPDLATIDPALMTLVRAKAAGLAGQYGFSLTDRDDIRQELLLDCWIRLGKFDPAKSSRRGFLHRVVSHRIATLLDAQRAACRDYRMCRDSLDAPVQFAASESIELGETVSSDAYKARMGRSRISSHDRVELQIDVARVIAALPAELAGVACLLKSVNAVDAGRRMGLSRSTLYRRIVMIREVFVAAGLHGYLGRSNRCRFDADLASAVCFPPRCGAGKIPNCEPRNRVDPGAEGRLTP
jgi:RNA polymerase sigma-70 factor (ECF subfamily)